MGTEALPASFLWSGETDQARARIGRMCAASILFHIVVLAAVGAFRLPAKVEKPLSSYQVSLVSLAARQAAPVPPSPPAPVEAEKPRPAPPPPVAVQRQPVPSPAKMLPPPAAPQPSRTVVPQPQAQIKDLLRGIKLPPQAIDMGDVSPAEVEAPGQRVPSKTEAPRKLKREIDQLLSGLSVPETAAPVETQPQPPKRTPADTLTKHLQSLETPPSLTAPPPQTARAAPAQPPATKLQVPGIGSGSNAYLATVQRRISAQWIAPPVDISGRAYKVVVRFRLDRTGSVSQVAVETPSGNEYFDIAAMRAVLKADPLPEFPKDLTESSLDAHFSFMVGGGVG